MCAHACVHACVLVVSQLWVHSSVLSIVILEMRTHKPYSCFASGSRLDGGSMKGKRVVQVWGGDLAVALSRLWLLSMSSFGAYQPSHASLSWQQQFIPVAAAKPICGSSTTWETASVPLWDRCQFLWAAAKAQKRFGASFPGAETSSSSAELCLLHGGLNCNSTLQAPKFLIIQISSLSCRSSFHKKLLPRHASTCRKFVSRKHLWEKMGRKPGGVCRTVRPWCRSQAECRREERKVVWMEAFQSAEKF